MGYKTRQGWIAVICTALLLAGNAMAQPLDITAQLERLMPKAGDSSKIQELVPLMAMLDEEPKSKSRTEIAEVESEDGTWGGLSLDLWEGPKVRPEQKVEHKVAPTPVVKESKPDSPIILPQIDQQPGLNAPSTGQVATEIKRVDEASSTEDFAAGVMGVPTEKTEEDQVKSSPRNLVVPDEPEVLNLSPMLGSSYEQPKEEEGVEMANEGEPPSLLGEEFAPEPNADLSKEISDERYRLRIGDQLVISIYGEPGTAREVVVDSTGAVSYLLVGRVPALGQTIDELREEMNRRIHRVFKYAFVTVTPSEFGGQYYTILGEVKDPGKKVLLGKTSVLSALCAAGGFRTGGFRSQTIDLADLNHAFLARDGDYVPVNFHSLVIEGDLTQDIDLRPGDYIYVPSALYKEIHILGAVNSATTIGSLNVVTLAEAISQARGLRKDASSRVIIIRGSLHQPIRIEADVKRIFKGLEKDIRLQPGDIVFCPTRRFESFRDWVKLGIRAFVGAVANTAGSRTFINWHPHSDSTIQNTIPIIP